MRIVRIIKPALFIFEVLKIIIFAIVLIIENQNSSIFIMAFFAVQGTLFPIMALFLCLDAVRYREYIPLFMTGKGIGIFILSIWSLFSQQSTIIGGFISTMALLSFELFALAAIFFIREDVIKITETPDNISAMEDK